MGVDAVFPPKSGAPPQSDINLGLTLRKGGKVKGESVAPDHVEDIAIRAFQWGVTSPTDSASGLASGRRQHHPLVLWKSLDTGTTALLSGVFNNDDIKTARLTVRKAGDGQLDYFTITLEGGRVSASQIEVDVGGQPLERVTLVYQKIGIEYRPQTAGGALGGSFQAQDDFNATAGA